MKKNRKPSARSESNILRLSATRKIVYSLAAMALAFGLLEGLLALVGVKSETYAKDPYVGFSSESPLYVAQREGAKTMLATARNRLSLFNPQRFSKQKEPGTFRIFSVGGSTTFGRPYADATSFSGWLREYLQAGARERKWEVINAGGVSYASYRVARLMEELIQYEPDLFIIYSGHNEFLERRLYTKVIEAPRLRHRLRRMIGRLKSATVVGRLIENALSRRKTPESDTLTVLSGEVEAQLDHTVGPSSYRRDETLKQQILNHYAFNMNRMIDIAESVGAKVILITPASNLRACSPFKSEHRDGLSRDAQSQWQTLFNRAQQALLQNAPEETLALLEEARKIDDLPAHLHFLRAQAFDQLGRFDDSKAAYLRARDEDICPLRAPEQVLNILRDVADRRQTPLVDFQTFLDSRSENRIPGAKEFLDHVHPSIESHRLLALEILALMEEQGVAASVRPDDGTIRGVTQKVMNNVDQRAHAIALMNLCKVLGWAGKRRDAYRAGVEAAKLAPDFPEVQFQAGLAARMLNQNHEAETYYQNAISLKPGHSEAHCALGVILEDKGRLEEALVHYRLALAHGKPENQERNQRNLDSVTRKMQSHNDSK